MSNFTEIRPLGTRQKDRKANGRAGGHGESDEGLSGTMRNRLKIRFARTDGQTLQAWVSLYVTALRTCLKLRRATNTSYGEHSLLFGNPRLWGLTVLNVAFRSFLYSFQWSVTSFKILGSSLFINNHIIPRHVIRAIHSVTTYKQ